MSVPLYIKISGEDNVAIAVSDIPAGTQVMDGVVAEQDIPQVYKITLCDTPKNGRIVHYRAVLGYTIDPIEEGQWINETVLKLSTPPSVDEIIFATDLATDFPDPPVVTWEGYVNPNGGYGDTRNILGISTTVQCVTGVLNVAVERTKRELLPKYPNMDDVVSINHAYGCGVAVDVPGAKVLIRAPGNLARHPNFGGELIVVGLGCEKFTAEMPLDEAGVSPKNVTTLQEKKGFDDMIGSLMGMTKKKLTKLNQKTRQTLPPSGLLTGMQCRGSDAFSGVTTNPSAGYAADMLVKGGATVLFSEITEVRDGIYLLSKHCINSEVGKKPADEMEWYDRYLENGQVDRSTSPTPGNKEGGLSNIVEKAMGSIVRSDTSPIVEALSSAERPSKKRLIYTATSANGIVCGPCRLASGTGLQVFTTDRGAPCGLAVAPVIKVCSRDDIKIQWQDLIDVNADPITTGEAAIQEIGTQLFREVIDVASGRKQGLTEEYKLYNDLCIFNPTPIT